MKELTKTSQDFKYSSQLNTGERLNGWLKQSQCCRMMDYPHTSFPPILPHTCRASHCSASVSRLPRLRPWALVSSKSSGLAVMPEIPRSPRSVLPRCEGGE